MELSREQSLVDGTKDLHQTYQLYSAYCTLVLTIRFSGAPYWPRKHHLDHSNDETAVTNEEKILARSIISVQDSINGVRDSENNARPETDDPESSQKVLKRSDIW